MADQSTKDVRGVPLMPLDLAHHFSRGSKKRIPNVLKEYYRFLRNPEMANFAGGMP